MSGFLISHAGKAGRRSVHVSIAIPQKDGANMLWNKCTACDEFVFRLTLGRNFYVCPYCGYCFPMPADARLHHLFDADRFTNLHPAAAQENPPHTVLATGRAVESDYLNPGGSVIWAGEGKITDCRVILVVVDPYAIFQSVHFLTLLAAMQTSLLKNLPLVTVFPSEDLWHGGETESVMCGPSSAQITRLTLELDRLSQRCLPQVTVLTDANSTHEFSTRFPLGDVVIAEQSPAPQSRSVAKSRLSRNSTAMRETYAGQAQPDVLVDLYVQRKDLPQTLGKLLAFFEK